MTIFKPMRSYFSAEKGVAAIETALILPFLLMLYFGMIDLTALISLNRKVTHVASVVADTASQNRNFVLKSDFTDYYNAVGLIMDPRPITDVNIVSYGYRKVAGAATQIWTTSKGAGPTCTSTPSTAAMLPLMTANNDLIVTIACTTYTPFMATFLGESLLGATTFNLEQTVMMRPRQGAVLNCYQTTVVAGTLCT